MEEDICMCGHKRSEHIKAEDEFGDTIYRCSAGVCKCEAFYPMDKDDVEFINAIFQEDSNA